MEEVDEETVGIIIELPVSIELQVGQYELPVGQYELSVGMELPVGQYELPVGMELPVVLAIDREQPDVG